MHGYDSVRVEGSVIAGSRGEAGVVTSGYMGSGTYDPSGSAWIGGSIIGGSVSGENSMRSIYVGGSVIGGTVGARHLGQVVIKGSLVGGGGFDSGAIFADEEVGSITPMRPIRRIRPIGPIGATPRPRVTPPTENQSAAPYPDANSHAPGT